MSMLKWAEEEVRLACEEEKLNNDELVGYGCACYEGALEAFKVLCKQGHSGFSIKITQGILNRLIDGKPLTAIEDVDSVWNDIHEYYDKNAKKGTKYQCKRMSSLFKDVRPDGTVKYNDIDRVYCYDIDNENVSYHSGLADTIINEMFPIEFPYYPPSKSFKMYAVDFLVDPKNGDFDTMGFTKAIKPNGEVIEINRYFREPNEGEVETYPGWVEISEEEYREREKNQVEREWMV